MTATVSKIIGANKINRFLVDFFSPPNQRSAGDRPPFGHLRFSIVSALLHLPPTCVWPRLYRGWAIVVLPLAGTDS